MSVWALEKKESRVRIKLLRLSGKRCLKRWHLIWDLQTVEGVSHSIVCIPGPRTRGVQRPWGRSLLGSAPDQVKAREDRGLPYVRQCFLWELGLKPNERDKTRLIFWPIPMHSPDLKCLCSFPSARNLVPPDIGMALYFLQVSDQISSYWEAFPGHTIKVSDKQG